MIKIVIYIYIYLICCEFEIVKAVIIQYKPPSLPAFISSSLFPQPALTIGIKEGVHQIITIIFRNL